MSTALEVNASSIPPSETKICNSRPCATPQFIARFVIHFEEMSSMPLMYATFPPLEKKKWWLLLALLWLRPSSRLNHGTPRLRSKRGICKAEISCEVKCLWFLSGGFVFTLKRRAKRKWRSGRKWPRRRSCCPSRTNNWKSASRTSTRQREVSLFFSFLFLCSPHDVSQNRSVLNGCSLVIVKLDYSRPGFPTTAALELRDEPSRLAEERGEVVQAVPGWLAFQEPARIPQPFWAQPGGKTMRPNVFASISVDFQLRFIRAGLPKSPVLGSGHLVAGHTERGGKK